MIILYLYTPHTNSSYRIYGNICINPVYVPLTLSAIVTAAVPVSSGYTNMALKKGVDGMVRGACWGGRGWGCGCGCGCSVWKWD